MNDVQIVTEPPVYVYRTHFVDGESGRTACDLSYIAVDEDLTGDWLEVTCVDCLLNHND